MDHSGALQQLMEQAAATRRLEQLVRQQQMLSNTIDGSGGGGGGGGNSGSPSLYGQTLLNDHQLAAFGLGGGNNNINNNNSNVVNASALLFGAGGASTNTASRLGGGGGIRQALASLSSGTSSAATAAAVGAAHPLTGSPQVASAALLAAARANIQQQSLAAALANRNQQEQQSATELSDLQILSLLQKQQQQQQQLQQLQQHLNNNINQTSLHALQQQQQQQDFDEAKRLELWSSIISEQQQRSALADTLLSQAIRGGNVGALGGISAASALQQQQNHDSILSAQLSSMAAAAAASGGSTNDKMQQPRSNSLGSSYKNNNTVLNLNAFSNNRASLPPSAAATLTLAQQQQEQQNVSIGKLEQGRLMHTDIGRGGIPMSVSITSKTLINDSEDNSKLRKRKKQKHTEEAGGATHPHVAKAAAAGGSGNTNSKVGKTPWRTYMNEEGKNEGKWTNEERQQFQQSYDRFGKDLEKFVPYIPTRNLKQIQSYYSMYKRHRLSNQHADEPEVLSRKGGGTGNELSKNKEQLKDKPSGSMGSAPKKGHATAAAPSISAVPGEADDPDKMNRKWTDQERSAFHAAYTKYGKQLEKFVELIPTRTLKQIKAYYGMYKRYKLTPVDDGLTVGGPSSPPAHSGNPITKQKPPPPPAASYAFSPNEPKLKKRKDNDDGIGSVNRIPKDKSEMKRQKLMNKNTKSGAKLSPVSSTTLGTGTAPGSTKKQVQDCTTHV